jgi:TatD DNase family protein
VTPLVDIGANLAHDSFDADRDAVLERARAAGVVAMIVTGSTLDDTDRAIALCRQHPQLLRATAGVHPTTRQACRKAIRSDWASNCSDPMVVAAGESGLDYFRNFSPPVEQRRAFELQLGLAERQQKPLFLHHRDAQVDFLAMLRAHPRVASRAVLHCFTKGRPCSRIARARTIHWSDWLDLRRAAGSGLREAAPHIPADRLMLETDAPYLLPRTLRPKPAHRRNEPAFLPAVLEMLAQCRGEDAAALAATTTANAGRFFGLTLRAAVDAPDAAPQLVS